MSVALTPTGGLTVDNKEGLLNTLVDFSTSQALVGTEISILKMGYSWGDNPDAMQMKSKYLAFI